MGDSKYLKITQTIKVWHNVTIERSWYDIEERAIVREIDTDGRVVSEEVQDTRIVEAECELEEEELSRDEDTPDEELIEETFDDED
jgi:hypothetical protein